MPQPDTMYKDLTEEELVAKLSPEEAVDAVFQADEERQSILTGLANKIEALFVDRANQRTIKDGEWDTCYRLYHAPLVDGDNYYSDRPFDHKPKRKRPTPNIVRTKVDTAVSNSVSMQFAAGEKNWDLFPPANANTPQVNEKCRLMSKEIEAQLNACSYPIHARRAIEDRVMLGTGILKGPVNTGKMKTRFVKVEDQWIPKVEEDKKPSIEHVPVFRFYPDMNVANFSESMDAIQCHPKTAIELSLLRANPGFDKDQIDKILYDEGGIKPNFYHENFLNKLNNNVWSSPYMYKDRYTVLEYHGPVTYDDACKLGLEPTYESPTMEYYGEVWVCCGRVIRMELENIEAQFETPYAVSTWKKDPTSPFGFGLPLILADSQRVVTQSYHMILDNASLTSGPQVALYSQYIQPVDGTYDISPNKVWLLTDPQYGVKDAINFFYPPNVIGQIMPVLQLAKAFADEESAATSMAAGLASPQNMDSATGQLIMQQSSTTLLDFFAEEWDDQVTEKIIRRMYAWNMQYNPKDEIKGDYTIDVKSSSEYKNKQMYVRDLERLAMQVGQDPSMALWINPDELTNARLALMSIPSNKIVRSQQEHDEAAAQQKQQPNPDMIELQIKAEAVKNETRRIALMEQELQFKATKEMQALAWDHEERMGANQARHEEAQASVIGKRAEVEVELLKLAQKDRALAMQMQSNLQLKENDNLAKVYLKGMETQLKTRELDQTDEELAIKKSQGSGI